MNKLNQLRKKIEWRDREILKMISRRLSISKEVGSLKAKANKPITDKARESKQKKLFIKLAKTHGLDQKFVLKFLKALLDESKRVQKYVQ